MKIHVIKTRIIEIVKYPIKLIFRDRVNRYLYELSILIDKKTHNVPKQRRCGMTETVFYMTINDDAKIKKYISFINKWQIIPNDLKM